MQATAQWMATSGAAYRAEHGSSGVVSLKHYNARFQEWGSGRPLVLVPGLAGGFELLGPLARALAERYRVITYQLRGEDDCFALRRRFGMTDLAADLAEFVGEMGLERPLVAGVSFGGVVAMQFAARFPRRLDAVAVQGVGLKFERSIVQRIARLVLNGYPLPHNSPFVNQFFNLLFGGKPPRPTLDFVTRLCWGTDQSVMAHRMAMLEGLDLATALPAVRCPVLLIGGSKDIFVTEHNLLAVQNHIADARVRVLPKAGHLAAVTHAQAIAEAMTAFMG